MSGGALAPEQRARLLAAKLGALVDAAPADRWSGFGTGLGERTPVAFGGGAALVSASTAWVLLDDPSVHGLGSVLAWARNRGSDRLVVIADEVGDLARQADYFADPPLVLGIHGRELVRGVPTDPIEAATAPEAALALTGDLAAAGLDVVVEHGVVAGEVLGLEVARVVIDPDGTGRIEVGVGRNDREAFTMLHGNLPPEAAIRMVADAVRQHRRAGAPSHPLNRLGGERWLLAHLLADPARLVGWQLQPVPGPVPRVSVNDRLPAFAFGTDADGAPVVLATSVGIDLELVPRAADVRARECPDATLVIAVPARDAHAVTTHLAALLAEPAEVLPVEGDWRR